MFKLAIALYFTVCSATAIAGSWSSGGTELLGDARNPWFLSNTRHATYCILLDDQNHGVTKALAADTIKRALSFWEREFRFGIGVNFPDFGKLQIASQVWEERTCTDTNDDLVDLRFQFGMLNPEQEDYLKNPAKFAAISVRTDYDKVELKGKGFIYVSPVQGRLAYQGARGQTDFWTKENGKNLYFILLHELGHIYGLPHYGPPWSLMSEVFAEYSQDAHPLAFDQYFAFPRGKKFCAQPLPDLYKKLFNISNPTHTCFLIEYTQDQGAPPHAGALFRDVDMKVYAGNHETDTGTLMGTATLSLGGFQVKSASYIWLSPQQKVFSQKDLSTQGATLDRVPGIPMMRFTKRGTYHNVDGTIERIMSVSFEQGSSSTSGSVVLDGELWDAPF